MARWFYRRKRWLIPAHDFIAESDGEFQHMILSLKAMANFSPELCFGNSGTRHSVYDEEATLKELRRLHNGMGVARVDAIMGWN